MNSQSLPVPVPEHDHDDDLDYNHKAHMQAVADLSTACTAFQQAEVHLAQFEGGENKVKTDSYSDACDEFSLALMVLSRAYNAAEQYLADVYTEPYLEDTLAERDKVTQVES